MEHWKKQAVGMLMGMTLEEKADPSVCSYVPSKTVICTARGSHRTVGAERLGVSSQRLYELLRALENEERANLRTIYIVKDAQVLVDASRPGYDSHIGYLSHSMAKSVTGMIIGTLIDEGTLALFDLVASFFPEYTYKDRRFATMTVEHLLMMSSGVPFAEVGVVTEEDWGRAFFSSVLNFAPGEQFMYNSMNSYILGRIAEKVSEKELFTLAQERLFAPLGITEAFWERNAQGHTKGGFGLYLSAASWAKLGSLYLTGGVYHGRRILSEEWIEQSSAVHMPTPPNLGDFDYGYHVWVNRMGGEVLFNGMLGQNVWIRPQNGMVAVLLSGNSELFQQSPALDLLRTYLFDLPKRDSLLAFRARRRLMRAQRHFFASRVPVVPLSTRSGLRRKTRCPFDTAWGPALGSYMLEQNNAALLPIFVRLLQNNYESDGIRTLTLSRVGEHLTLGCEIGESSYQIAVGLYDYVESEMQVRGERYLVRALGRADTGEDGAALYHIELVFPELPNTRLITLHIGEGGRVRLELSEVPDRHILESFRQSFLSPGAKGSMAFGLLQRTLGDGFLEEKAAFVFEKTLRGGRDLHPDTPAYMEELSAERTTRLNKYAAIQGLIRRFIGSSESQAPQETDKKSKPSWLGGVMSSILGRIKGRAEEAVAYDAILSPSDEASADAQVLPAAAEDACDVQQTSDEGEIEQIPCDDTAAQEGDIIE